MSEAAQETETPEVEAPEVEAAAEEEQQPELPAVDPAEVAARERGWLSLEEWTDQGKDPNDWAGFKHFNEKGTMINQLNSLKKKNKDFDERLSNNNKFYKAELERQKTELLSQRQEAMSEFDHDKLNKVDNQIQEIDKQQIELDKQPAVPTVSESDVQIEVGYFNTLPSNAQKVYAQSVAAQYIANDLSGQELVDAVRLEMEKEFPPVNPRRSKATMTNTKGAKPSSSKKSEPKIDVSDLTAGDKQVLMAMRNNTAFRGMSDKEILKVMQDTKL